MHLSESPRWSPFTGVVAPDPQQTQPPHLAVELINATRTFGSRTVLNSLNLTIKASEFVAVLGASGTGKTTLLRVLAGLDRADRGIVRVPKARAVVFQEPRLVQAKRVWENVVLGQRHEIAFRNAITALEEVGLGRHTHSWPKTLSGGEAQRVALARALVRSPDLLLLDEPFASLDALTRIKMHELVAQLWERHHPAVILVTHDVDEAILLADRIMVLADGLMRLDIPVVIPKPRERTDPAFGKLRNYLLAELGVHRTAAA